MERLAHVDHVVVVLEHDSEGLLDGRRVEVVAVQGDQGAGPVEGFADAGFFLEVFGLFQ